MGVLNGKNKESEEDLHKKIGRLEIQEEVADREAKVAEKEAIVKELKKRYGNDWKKTLGFNNLTDMDTLRSFLSSAKDGMAKSSNFTYNPALSPLVGRRHAERRYIENRPTGRRFE